MAVLTHPTLGTGGDAPTACAELVIDTFVGPLIAASASRIRHPEPGLLDSGGGGDAAVGYAS